MLGKWHFPLQLSAQLMAIHGGKMLHQATVAGFHH